MSTSLGQAASDVALYGHWICPFATRVEFALHQRGIDHELIDLPPSAVRGPDFVLPDEFVEHSPKLEIPLVRVGGDYLADSIPVLEWLENRVVAPALLPSDDADRRLVRDRMAWINRHAFRPMIGVYYGTDPDVISQASEALADALAEMGRWTTETGWLAGAEPSLAEAVAMPIHVRMAGLQRLGFTVSSRLSGVRTATAAARWPVGLASNGLTNRPTSSLGDSRRSGANGNRSTPNQTWSQRSAIRRVEARQTVAPGTQRHTIFVPLVAIALWFSLPNRTSGSSAGI